VTIKIIPNDRKNPPDKLADAEIHFEAGPLAGLKLVGFSFWKGPGDLPQVRFPQREYISHEGEKRYFPQLRAIRSADALSPHRLVDLLLQAYAAFVHEDIYRG
jgi:hypothetical protein